MPGTKVAGRYRIVSLIGRGGMGEVYRADDLKLGHTVALKFLPKDVAQDARRLDYFHSEVRLSRQISHPNVCRVYDIGEVEGQHFLSMEYVDGEDLRILLRRIGRLPKDKGLQIAQQLCAGLAAAHDRGVLHRDLKPANIMIDGRGQARITDFGLARLEGDGREGEAAGTPTYMAPEQLAQGKTSIQSDLYALGLILYELFTGEAANKAASMSDLMRSHENSTLAESSRFPEEVDPIVERVIVRCLAKDPTDRPKSVRAVAASLPGGDPLQAALAAGETPSPEMVAAAGESGGLSMKVGAPLLAGVCVVLAVLPFVSDWRDAYGMSRLKGKEPVVLKSVASDLIRSLGFDEAPAASGFGFETIGSKELQFWYRQSDYPMDPAMPDLWGFLEHWRVTPTNPSPLEPGMITVRLDPGGQLRALLAAPAEGRPEDVADTAPDWDVLFAAAGLEPTDFEPADEAAASSGHLPPMRVDQIRRWRTQSSGDSPLEITMAARDGRIVYFDQHVDVGEAQEDSAGLTAGAYRARGGYYVVVILGFTGLLALRNLRTRRADTQGALRCSLYYFIVDLVLWLATMPHLGSIAATASFGANGLIFTTAKALRLWLFYVAVEPFVRRFWPDVFVSWSRILSGRFRDPLVGRDLLVGCLIGSVWALVIVGTTSVTLPSTSFITGTTGFAHVLDAHQYAVHACMSQMAFLLLMRLLLRNTWVSAAAFVLGMSLMVISGDTPPDMAIRVVLSMATLAAVYIRLGLVAAIAMEISIVLLVQGAPTCDFGAWYSETAKFSLAAVLAVAGFGFYTSTIAGQLSNVNTR